MTADLPPWRRRTRVAERILSLNGTAVRCSMLDARRSTLVGLGDPLRSLSALQHQLTIDTFADFISGGKPYELQR
jgi:hypothetical protein